MRPQGDFTKFPCYLCFWDIGDTATYYHRRKWPQRTSSSCRGIRSNGSHCWTPGKYCFSHLQLDLMEQFTTALDKEFVAFKYLQDFFPELYATKFKAGVFVGPQIKKIIECKEFRYKLTRTDNAAWNSSVAVFLASWRIPRLKTTWSLLVINYGKIVCRMSLEDHILNAHLNKIKKNIRSSNASTSIWIYWTLNSATKDCITKKK